MNGYEFSVGYTHQMKVPKGMERHYYARPKEGFDD